MPLTFEELRSKNRGRCEAVFHQLDEWSVTDWACALAGEAGEAANIAKKLRRGWPSNLRIKESGPDVQARLTQELLIELADVVIYADLLAQRVGGSLEQVVREKFNRVSEELGSDVLL